MSNCQRVDVSLIRVSTNSVVPNAVSKSGEDLLIAIDSLTFTNVRLASHVQGWENAEFKLRISIGGTVAESNHFTLTV